MKKHDVLKSPRLSELKRRRRRGVLNKILLSLIALLVLFGGLSYIARIDRLNISKIEVSGNRVIDTELIAAVAADNLKGDYLWLLPKSNFLLFPKDKIKMELGQKYKRLKDVELSIKSPETLTITLSERQGKYTWCGAELPPLEIKTEEYACYFMDDAGFIFDEAPHFSGDVYFRFFGSLNESYFSPNTFPKIAAFRDFLSNAGMKPTSLYLKPDGDMEIYLSSNILPPDAPKIILKNDFNLPKLSENLQAALATEPLHSDFKNKYSSLLYIDLRFGNKVYFKFE